MKFLLSPVPSLCQPLSISIPICQARDPTGTPRHLQSMLSLVVAMTTPPLTAGLLVGREIQKFTFPGSSQGPVGVSWGAPYLTVFAEAMCWLRTGQTATGKSLVGKSKEGETRGRGQCHVGGRRPKKKEGLGLPGAGTYAGSKDKLVWPGTNCYYHASVFSPENRVQCSRNSGEH